MIEGTKLELPFAYLLHYVPHRARKPREAAVIDTGIFDLRSVSEGDAPVAIRWTLDDLQEDGHLLEARAFEGRLYRPVTTEAGKLISAEAFEAAMCAVVGPDGFSGYRLFVERAATRMPLKAAYERNWQGASLEETLRRVAGGGKAPAPRWGRQGNPHTFGRHLLFPVSSVDRRDGMDGGRGRTVVARRTRVGEEGDGAARDHADPALRTAFPGGLLGSGIGLRNCPVGTRSTGAVVPVGFAEVLLPDALRDDEVLLCEAMIEALGEWRSITEPMMALEGFWDGFPKSTRTPAELLFRATGQGSPQHDEALRLFEAAHGLAEILSRGSPDDFFGFTIMGCLGPCLRSLAFRREHGHYGMIDEDADCIAAAFDS